MDEILKELGDWKNKQDVLQAGRMAVQRINEYFVQDISFDQESTLCGQSICKNIKRA